MAHYKGAANEATRAMHMLRRREKAKEELEEKKRKLENDVKLSTIDNKFSTQKESIETQLKASTVGLVTLDEMRQRQETAIRERDKQLAQKIDDDSTSSKLHPSERIPKACAKTPKSSKSLSFYDDDDEEEEEDENDDDNEEKKEAVNKVDQQGNGIQSTRDNLESKETSPTHDDDDEVDSKSTKKTKLSTPWEKLDDIDAGFLPDREREEEERRLREQLAAEWRERQQKLKGEEIEITFSYWDGSGHRRVVRMKKGDSIYQFLVACLDTLRKDFNELRAVSADHLMYVKEDLIIPHHYTFYDFIVTKARGKSGPLFSFDVHEDVRLVADATVEKDESHAGKVLMRSWYERNKHIFPASRWEPYDPTKTYDQYTISDKRSR